MSYTGITLERYRELLTAGPELTRPDADSPFRPKISTMSLAVRWALMSL